MSMRVNAEGNIESVKTVPVEHISVIDDRQELVDALGRSQAAVQEISQDLADYDALVASRTIPAASEAPAATAPIAPQAPATSETPPTAGDPTESAQ